MDAVEEVKQRLGIEDVIGEYVQLKRAGRNWKGLSPFTSEKTPSFIVSPDKQIWHDFSSGQGGDVFSFVMEVEGLDFRAALELLARKAGVDLEQYNSGSRRSGPDKERLFQALELSAKFYQVQFSKSAATLKYVLGQRGFSKKTALEWQLGYAPNNGSALINFLKSKNFTEAEIKAAGLSARRYDNTADMFRGRLMVPLADGQGRVVGFTARLLDDQANAPKYINTPSTVLYDKSRHIFGLHLAKEAIRKSQFAVLVEGNLDVIASHQADVRQAVATAGTALTEQHLKALSRLTSDIRLCFDQDRAGLAATERAIPLASKAKISLSIIDVPSGKDPDELISQDPKIWQEIIEKPSYALDWLMERYAKLLNTKSAQGKREFSDVLLPVVRRLDDAVEQDHYFGAIAEIIGVSKNSLEQKAQTFQAGAPPLKRLKKADPTVLDRQKVENEKAQNHLLAIALAQPELRTYLGAMTPEMLFSEEARQLLELLKKEPDSGTNPTEGVRSLQDYDKILALQYEELYQGLEAAELAHEAARLQTRLVENFVRKQKKVLSKKLQTEDGSAAQEILVEVKRLDSLLKQTTEGLYAEKES